MRDDDALENRVMDEAPGRCRTPKSNVTRVDGHLSITAQRVDPTALVVIESGAWLLRRPGQEDIRLGAREPSSYGDALQALHAWVSAQKASAKPAPVCQNCEQTPHRATCVHDDPVGKARS